MQAHSHHDSAKSTQQELLRTLPAFMEQLEEHLKNAKNTSLAKCIAGKLPEYSNKDCKTLVFNRDMLEIKSCDDYAEFSTILAARGGIVITTKEQHLLVMVASYCELKKRAELDKNLSRIYKSELTPKKEQELQQACQDLFTDTPAEFGSSRKQLAFYFGSVLLAASSAVAGAVNEAAPDGSDTVTDIALAGSAIGYAGILATFCHHKCQKTEHGMEFWSQIEDHIAKMHSETTSRDIETGTISSTDTITDTDDSSPGSNEQSFGQWALSCLSSAFCCRRRGTTSSPDGDYQALSS